MSGRHAVNPFAHRLGAPGPIESAYQPVVEFGSGALVGFEALVRPAAGSVWASPGEMFAAAARCDATIDFDWQCRVSALTGALVGNLPRELALFVNAEPRALDAPPPAYARPVLADAARLSIVVEITERHLMKNPAGLLRAALHARDRGWRIAVDDVGADSSSLAMLALLRPDIIKLDMRLVHQRTTAETAAILSAVAAESERTGAVIVAEGIENETHERRAQYLGARWGQGWFYGPPAALPKFEAVDRLPVRQLAAPAMTVRAPTAVTPFGLDQSRGAVKSIDESLLETLEDDLLDRAASMGPTAVVLVTVPYSTIPSAARHAAFARLSTVSALTVVFGRPMEAVVSYRTVDVDVQEPLALERSVIVVDPLFNAALIALDLGENPDGLRTYRYRLTFDRDQVLDAATLLMHSIPQEL
ncbi:EAL domain-containing protein [Rhodococcus sp. G-MC3]|uniref:EAL domain-containing protein n=1 Tax=Rhodococcus sp. G-MC3 TaxID=3046209 RepID=UPI0024BB1311|nr:EAL domain-containing protein [Rhodococcus sp. G-MC3]MDJ0392917.1 EAL domain-containing protein [Rhodococcus sp. G-MC3]